LIPGAATTLLAGIGVNDYIRRLSNVHSPAILSWRYKTDITFSIQFLLSYPNKIKNIFFEFFDARKLWHFKGKQTFPQLVVAVHDPDSRRCQPPTAENAVAGWARPWRCSTRPSSNWYFKIKFTKMCFFHQQLFEFLDSWSKNGTLANMLCLWSILRNVPALENRNCVGCIR
jgi:hypothetical protein